MSKKATSASARTDLPATTEAITPRQLSGEIALADIRPCPFNIRKHFDLANIAGLAASIDNAGLKDPLLVRPIPLAGKTVDLNAPDWRANTDHFELADGERRYRALHLLAKTKVVGTVPVIVRCLTDDEVRAIMLASREQSCDLATSELVAGYVALRTSQPDDATVATLVGKPVNHVRSILRLAKLPVWALAAIDAGTLPRATAELVARVPGEESRKKAAACVRLGWVDPRDLPSDFEQEITSTDHILVDGPLSFRDTKDLIRNHFTQELKGSPFDRKSLDLLPEAGSCEACPKRAGNDEEAKAEGVRADVCLDPDCYRAKCAAHRAAEIAKAADKGILDAEIEEEFAVQLAPKGWCDITTEVWQTELHLDFPIGAKRRDENLKDLLGKLCPQKYVAFARDGSTRTLVKTKEAREALVDAGVLKKPEKRKPEKRTALVWKSDPSGITKTEGPTFGEVIRRAVGIAANVLAEYGEEQFAGLTSLDDAEEDGPILEALRMIAGVQAYDALVNGYRISVEKDVLLARFPGIQGRVESHREDEKAIEAIIALWSAPKLLAFLLQLAATHEMQQDGPNRSAAENMLAWAELEWDALEKQARRELAGGESAEEKIAKAEEQQAETSPPETATSAANLETTGPKTETVAEIDPLDLTAEKEEMYAQEGRTAPADEWHRTKIAEWRQRQAAGDTEPKWGKWSEFDLLLSDGRSVRVLYDPNWLSRDDDSDHFEFRGEAISSTGYRSHFEMFDKRPKITLEAWTLRLVEELAAVEKVEKLKRERREKRDAKKTGNAILNGNDKSTKKAKPKKARAH